MKAISIPFREQFREDMIHDRKTETSRSHKYGEPGDRFKAFDYEFELTKVVQEQLTVIAQHHYRQEGFSQPAGFMEVWMKLHRGIWNPNKLVWLHTFKRVSGL